MDDRFEERLHQVSPPSEREDASSPSSVSLTDSHRDPSAGAPTRQVVSSAGAEYSRRCWRRDCLLVPLEDLLQRKGLSNRQVASTLAHRRRQCDQMPWPAFLDKIRAELDTPTRDVTNAFLEQVAIITQRRLTASEFQRIRSTGRWNDPGKSAIEAIFTRLLVSQLSDGIYAARDWLPTWWKEVFVGRDMLATGRPYLKTWYAWTTDGRTSSGSGTGSSLGRRILHTPSGHDEIPIFIDNHSLMLSVFPACRRHEVRLHCRGVSRLPPVLCKIQQIPQQLYISLRRLPPTACGWLKHASCTQPALAMPFSACRRPDMFHTELHRIPQLAQHASCAQPALAMLLSACRRPDMFHTESHGIPRLPQQLLYRVPTSRSLHFEHVSLLTRRLSCHGSRSWFQYGFCDVPCPTLVEGFPMQIAAEQCLTRAQSTHRRIKNQAWFWRRFALLKRRIRYRLRTCLGAWWLSFYIWNWVCHGISPRTAKTRNIESADPNELPKPVPTRMDTSRSRPNSGGRRLGCLKWLFYIVIFWSSLRSAAGVRVVDGSTTSTEVPATGQKPTSYIGTKQSGDFSTYRPQFSVVQKRSLRRAIHRAECTGHTTYKGRFFTIHQLLGLKQGAQLPTSSSVRRSTRNTQVSSGHYSILSWNVGGLTNSLLDEIQAWLALPDNVHYQIITIQETRWTFSSEWSNKNWTFIHSISLLNEEVEF